MREARDGRAAGTVLSRWCYAWMNLRPKIKLFGNMCPQSHPNLERRGPTRFKRWNLTASTPQGNSDQATVRIFPPCSTKNLKFNGPGPPLTSETHSLIHWTHIRYNSTKNSAAVQNEDF